MKLIVILVFAVIVMVVIMAFTLKNMWLDDLEQSRASNNATCEEKSNYE